MKRTGISSDCLHGPLGFKVQSLIPSDMYGANSLNEVVDGACLYRVPHEPFFFAIYMTP